MVRVVDKKTSEDHFCGVKQPPIRRLNEVARILEIVCQRKFHAGTSIVEDQFVGKLLAF